MKKNVLLLLCLFASLANGQNQVLQGVSFFSPRSQSVNAARYSVGWHPYTHRVDAKRSYVTFSITPEVTKSFHANRIADALFGTDTLFISGSQVETRNENAILADYYGLSTEFVSEVQLEPSIKNFLTTFSMFAGFDSFVPGLYLVVHAPAVWTRWNFDMCETVLQTGSDVPFPERYMDTDEVNPAYGSFTQALRGNRTYGDMTEPLKFGKVCGAQTKGGLSDLLVTLGYDIINRPGGYAGFNLRMAAPTGSRPESCFFFEPIVGNGKHWEFGIGFAGRGLIWEQDGEQTLNIYADLNFNHLFKARQRRTFDYCPNGFGSRYILLKEFDSDGNYTGVIQPAINITTLCCDVRVDLQFEFLFMFGYNYKGLTFDIGYNGWIRSKERIELLECIPERTYGLKGIQNVITNLGDLDPTTQSKAKLHGNQFANMAIVADEDSPVFLRTADLDVRSAASPMLLTHKFFTNLSYGWQESPSDWFIPYFGMGASVEFEGVNTASDFKPNRNTLSQWAFWAKGGFAFS